jgi:hypothetical protein
MTHFSASYWPLFEMRLPCLEIIGDLGSHPAVPGHTIFDYQLVVVATRWLTMQRRQQIPGIVLRPDLRLLCGIGHSSAPRVHNSFPSVGERPAAVSHRAARGCCWHPDHPRRPPTGIGRRSAKIGLPASLLGAVLSTSAGSGPSGLGRSLQRSASGGSRRDAKRLGALGA